MKRSTLHSLLAAASFTLAASYGVSSSAQDPAHPDLSGIWTLTKPINAAKTEDGKTPPLTPAAKAVYEKNLAMAKKGNRSFDGVSECLPPGMPYAQLLNKPFQVLQKPDALYFLYQENRVPRWVYINQPHPPADEIDPTFMGDASAKWEGDTLVADIVGLNDKTVLDRSGLPHSANMKLTERLSVKDGILTDRITINDPANYSAPWTTVATYKRAPAFFRIPEEVCATRVVQTHVDVNGKVAGTAVKKAAAKAATASAEPAKPATVKK